MTLTMNHRMCGARSEIEGKPRATRNGPSGSVSRSSPAVWSPETAISAAGTPRAPAAGPTAHACAASILPARRVRAQGARRTT